MDSKFIGRTNIVNTDIKEIAELFYSDGRIVVLRDRLAGYFSRGLIPPPQPRRGPLQDGRVL